MSLRDPDCEIYFTGWPAVILIASVWITAIWQVLLVINAIVERL